MIHSRMNAVLIDARMYKAERSLMANPKDWAHVLKQVSAYRTINPWHASEGEIKQAMTVLGRLASLERYSIFGDQYAGLPANEVIRLLIQQRNELSARLVNERDGGYKVGAKAALNALREQTPLSETLNRDLALVEAELGLEP